MDNIKSVIISCSTKFHAFAMAEQFEKHGVLLKFFTTFSSQRNALFQKFVRRVDKEAIPKMKFETNLLIATCIKLFPSSAFFWNNIFDKWVAYRLRFDGDFDVFIGWSGMSLHSIRHAKKLGKITILERGSSHIVFQNNILKNEYAKFNISFSINKKIIEKELQEYQEADYISIPSNFVKNSFIEMGISESKLLLNPYGVNTNNFDNALLDSNSNKKLKLLYLGNLSFRKGLPYLFEALKSLKKYEIDYEMHFIGSISEDFKEFCNLNKDINWKFHGHIPHHQLKSILLSFDMAIHPSLEEGLSMVIAQLLASGIPVIATTNTGGEELIKDGFNGFIIPIRNSNAITEKIKEINNNRSLLSNLKLNSRESIKNRFTWDDYGNRWKEILEKIA
jgi:glycosyltransferase involved in cell wall biosynthesis